MDGESITVRMSETTTVKMGESGRVTIPKPVRESLGVNGEEVLLSIEVEVSGDD